MPRTATRSAEVGCRLTPDVLDALRKVAKRRGVSLSEAMRNAVIAYIESATPVPTAQKEVGK